MTILSNEEVSDVLTEYKLGQVTANLHTLLNKREKCELKTKHLRFFSHS